MARFGSFGGGAAQGLQAGLAIGQRQKEFEEQKKQHQTEKFRATTAAAYTASVEQVKRATELAAKAAEQNATPEQIRPLREMAQIGAAGYATTVESYMKRAELDGASTEELQMIAQSMGDPTTFIDQQMALFEGAVEVGRLEFGNRPPPQGSTFNARVRMNGEERDARVETIRNEATHNFEFFVTDATGRHQLSGTDISPSTTKSLTTTGDLQIPGLDADDSSREITALRQQIGAANGYAALANQTVETIGNDPKKIGTTADAIRFMGSFTQQLKGGVEALGFFFTNENGESVTKELAAEMFDFGDIFDDLNVEQAAELKRTTLDLLFLDLAAKGQTGRAVSDRDLAIFMEETGIRSGDPKQLAAGLGAGIRNNKLMLEQNVRARTGNAFTIDDIAPGGMVDFKAPGLKAKASSAVAEAMKANDYDRAEAIMDAIDAGDEKTLQRLLDAASK